MVYMFWKESQVPHNIVNNSSSRDNNSLSVRSGAVRLPGLPLEKGWLLVALDFSVVASVMPRSDNLVRSGALS